MSYQKVSYIAKVAHISDTHFVKRLTMRGRRIWTTVGVKSHSFAKTQGLAGWFEEFRYWGLDLAIVTGDISTDGSGRSLETAREFFRSEEIYGKGVSRDFLGDGLGLHAEQLLVLPGNHDRYGGGLLPLQTESGEFEEVFDVDREDNPRVVAYQRKELGGLTAPPLLFFIFDSTLPESVSAQKWDRVARGYIGPAQCEGLRNARQQIIEDKRVSGTDGALIDIDYDSAIRIAVIHHHPVLPPENGVAAPDGVFESIRNKIDGLHDFTLMVNNSEFVGACFDAGIDVVLFGHQHLDYWLPCESDLYSDFHNLQEPHKMYFFCCPSTSEYSSESGFNMIHFNLDGFTLVPYRWNGRIFIEEEDEERFIKCKYGRVMPWQMS